MNLNVLIAQYNEILNNITYATNFTNICLSSPWYPSDTCQIPLRYHGKKKKKKKFEKGGPIRKAEC
jgi:hypothetical protein